MKQLGARIYRFADIEVDPAQCCLRRQGQEQHLRQKTFQTLLYLIEQRRRLVTKDELIAQVWQGVAVTDDALVKCIVDLRKALGDDPRHPQFIRTISKAGYRFIGPVEEFSPEPPAAAPASASPAFQAIAEISARVVEYEEEIPGDDRPAIIPHRLPRWIVLAAALLLIPMTALTVYFAQKWWSAGRPIDAVALPRVPGRKPLAVMYFENQAGDRELDWLRAGLADMLITDLARSKKLNVLSRQQLHLLLERIGHRGTEAIRLDDALALGRRSQAEVVALGSFAKLGEKVRINVQLYDAWNSQMLASESVVADQADQILTQMDLLSLKLAHHLGAAPAADDPQLALVSAMTSSLDAYRYYSLALEQAQMWQFPEAIELLEKAVALDPQFAMAYARIGYVYAVRIGQGEKAKPYLEKALQLSDRLTEKDKLYITAWDASAKQEPLAAIETYQKLIAQYPLEVEAHQRLCWLLIQQEKFDDALLVVKRGLVVDPEAKDLYNGLGGIYANQGKYEEAIAAFERYVRLAPSDPNALDSLGTGHQTFGRYPEAISAYQRALALNPESRVAIIHLGNAYFQQGRYRAAIEQYHRFLQVARDDAGRGRGYDYLARVYLKRGELNRAEAAARQARRYYQQLPWVSLLIAVARGDLRAAERLKPEVLRQLSQAEMAGRGTLKLYYYHHGYVALQSGRAEEAIAHFTEALRHQQVYWSIDPLEDCLANAYLELGRWDEAIAEYERLLRLNPHYPLAQYRLGQAYERKGEREQARAAYRRFLQIWKDADPGIAEVIAAKAALAAQP
jgi:tetratricopeptide (TPR) repeat protein/DNA-binding winged helix-turn-helix (wHTH) protein